MTLNPTRRNLLTSLAFAGGAILLGADRLSADEQLEIDKRVAHIISDSIIVDIHNHLELRGIQNPNLDLAGAMKHAGFSAVCQTWAIDNFHSDRPGDYEGHFLDSLEFEDRLLAKNHMRRALDLKDLETAHAHRQPIIIQATEGAQFLEGKLERMEDAHKRGLRVLGLVHERDDLVQPLGDVYTATAHMGGLTAFGSEVVKACNHLGIVIDVSHGSREMVAQVVKVSAQPIMVSHTSLANEANPSQLTDVWKPRVIPDDVAQAVVDSGGLIGVWAHMASSLQEFVTNIKRTADVLGIDHVAIGTDTELTPSKARVQHTNEIWHDGVNGFFYAVANEMLKQSFSPKEIAKVGGGNFCRLFARVTGRQL
jgi:membrane dipeptidase